MRLTSFPLTIFLITSLGQSKYLEVMYWERLRDLAGERAAGASPEAVRDLWFEICRREGVRAIVLGSFTKAENLFATDAKVYDVQTKDLLKSDATRGEGVASILRTQIDELSREISKGVGLSDRAAARHAVPITTVTTASMEAYELFLKGREEFDRYYFDRGPPIPRAGCRAGPRIRPAALLPVQVAGLIARRIICQVQPDETVRRGQRFGMICFGSRLDVYLPQDVALAVSVGERVQAGTSILGRFPEAAGRP